MIKKIIFFHLTLISLLLISFLVHQIFVISANMLFFYVVNAVAASLVYCCALIFYSKQKEYLIFYFLFGTILKFLIFFIIVLPQLKSNDIITKSEFMMFFIPYLISLFAETLWLVLLSRNTNTNILKK